MQNQRHRFLQRGQNQRHLLLQHRRLRLRRNLELYRAQHRHCYLGLVMYLECCQRQRHQKEHKRHHLNHQRNRFRCWLHHFHRHHQQM